MTSSRLALITAVFACSASLVYAHCGSCGSGSKGSDKKGGGAKKGSHAKHDHAGHDHGDHAGHDHAAKSDAGDKAKPVADATVVSPKNYKVIKENSNARIIQGNFKPGERDKWHGHPESAIHIQSGGSGTVHFPDGTTKKLELKTGASILQPAVSSHSFENTGKTEIRFVMVEIKK